MSELPFRATRHWEMLDDLLRQGKMDLRAGRVFSETPPALDLARLRADRRIEGMLYGLAVGDALGFPTEYRYDPDERRREFGTILDHVTTRNARAGTVSDDTQMSFWTLEQLLDAGEFDLDDLTRRFVERRTWIVGPGQNVTASLERHAKRLEAGTPLLLECAGDPRIEGRGNGALMRYAPLLLPHLRTPSTQLWVDVTLASFITHCNGVALSSTLAFAHLLWQVLARPTGDVPEPEWWLDEYLRVAGDLEARELPCPLSDEPTYIVPKLYRDYRGTFAQFLDTHFREAWRRRVPLRRACSQEYGFGSRNDSVQTVPAVLYVLMSHADSYESAVIAAVNDTKDNDSVASVVGALLGALHGEKAIRRRWFDGIGSASISGKKHEHNGEDRETIRRLTDEAVGMFLV